MSDQQTEQALGKYTILRELGRGGFATVYLAQDNVLRRSIALKILHPLLLADPDFVRRFEQEAHATAQLDHPHIATIYELGQLDGRLYIAIQLLAGGTLADRIKQRGPLPFGEAVRVVGEIAEALDHAHTASFVHRDVKPTNILFNARDEAVLTDFGMVKAVESSVIARSTMGNVIGTPPYIAPEVWEGKQDGPGTDVYALGCVLFEMLTGELLFKGSTPPAVMLAHFQRHQYPARWPEGVPPQVEALLERALSRDRTDRHARAGALAADLRTLAAPVADPLAERYRALQAASAAQEWERASQLAQEIAAQNPVYRDVPALGRQAAEGQARAAQSRQVAQWRSQALAADRRVQESAAPSSDESPLKDAGQQVLQQSAPGVAGMPQAAPEVSQSVHAIDHQTAVMQSPWRAIALTIFAWAISEIIIQYIGVTTSWTPSGGGSGVVIGAGISGLCLGYISRLMVAGLRTKQILLMGAAWAAAGLVAWVVGFSISRSLIDANVDSDPAIGWMIGDTLSGAIGGLLTALVLRRAVPSLPSSVTYIFPMGWSIGSILGLLIARTIPVSVFEQMGSPNGELFFRAVVGAIAGAIGGGIMFVQFIRPHRKDERSP
ncbi:MAG TPA: protein kinase [Roseiflexaceae bacterium]